ncbi:phosphonate ABC transporter, permease PhnE [Enterococcus sp. 8G7_MSG3316]|uniref:Phosphonate ABC transporter, permease PhnE n=1 Tax=Candidatus Enterococcus testudinis TaxID=1834191 RepID=A0A242A5A0_9ENTE|nr:phosphonate ABC transporter, permease protein PhnE [Enterococcus sp. 8G7_MSG3316]OTN76070.1 phosphonate ABC transporter, permease PhnE [Enterococcus sp. 8G7_MSG3316]
MMLPAEPKQKKVKLWLLIFAIVVMYIWAFSGIPFNGVKDNAGQIIGSIFDGLIHPDWSYVYTGDGEDLISLMIQTVAIAFVGTFISSILSIPFAFWAARSKNSPRFLSGVGKVVLTAIRTFPEIVLAIMFIKTVGPGSFAGVLAVSVHSIGMLAKLYSEAIENMDQGPSESVISAGGNRWDVLGFATLPQLIPEFLSFTLYRFELAVRSASILGIVGAGGIGTPMIFAINARSWNRVGIILLGIVVTVTVIDFISGRLRKRLV